MYENPGGSDNKWKWLRPYNVVARWVGWILLILGTLGIIGCTVGSMQGGPRFWSNICYLLRDVTFPGILALTVAQFLRYLLDADIEPGWLLRRARYVLAIGAAIYLVSFGEMLGRCVAGLHEAFVRGGLELAVSVALGTNVGMGPLSLAVPVIVLVGFSEAARRLVPMIEESRELV